jgi:hypothetical protein
MYKIINGFGLAGAVMTKHAFMDHMMGIHDKSKSTVKYWVNFSNKVWNEAKEFTISENMVNQIEHALNRAGQNFMNSRMVEAVSSKSFKFHKKKYDDYGVWTYKFTDPIRTEIRQL